MQTHEGERAQNTPEQFAAWLEKATRQQILALKDRLILQTVFFKNSLSEAEAALTRKHRQLDKLQALYDKKKAANQRLLVENESLRAELKRKSALITPNK